MKKVFWLGPLLLAIPALAVIPRFWEVRTYGQFSRGELDGLSVTGEGALVLAPPFDLLFETGEPLIFSAATDSAGNVYLGSGHDGGVYKVEPDGRGMLLADLSELDVLALIVDEDDTLFAATSPNGKVYRIDPDGAPEVFFDPETRYIWDMAFDSAGRLLVATGDEGEIYRVDPDGQSELFYDTEETHIVTIAFDGAGNLIAGGDPKGYVYRISQDGQAFVLYDSGMREVRSVAVTGDGTVYAAVLDSSGAGGAPESTSPANTGTDTPRVNVHVDDAARQSVAAQNGGARSTQSDGSSATGGDGASGRGATQAGARSVILRILPDGAVTSIWDSRAEMVFSLLPRDERLLFSTGTNGRIYAFEGSRRPTLLVESSEEQTTRLLAYGDRIFATSSNAGKLFELGYGSGTEGIYQSRVRDTGAISSWGKIAWTGRGVAISTRTGNTASPDATWSDWAPIGANGAISSPRARFIQWRGRLDADLDPDPSLSSVVTPYLQQNFSPEVRSIDVLRPGLAFREQNTNNQPLQGPASTGISGRVLPTTQNVQPRAVVETGARAIRWSAYDENGDALRYSIFYRAENEGEWKPLQQGIGETFYTIAPDTLPDGMYVLRLVASDIGSNPPELALEGQLDTRPFAIDNTPPSVTMRQDGLEGQSARLRVEAVDQASTLKQAEASVDAGPWRPVFPLDGIVDSKSEEFEFSSMKLDAGEHVVAFRIYDQNENVGIAKTIVRIP